MGLKLTSFIIIIIFHYPHVHPKPMVIPWHSLFRSVSLVSLSLMLSIEVDFGDDTVKTLDRIELELSKFKFVSRCLGCTPDYLQALHTSPNHDNGEMAETDYLIPKIYIGAIQSRQDPTGDIWRQVHNMRKSNT